MLLGSGIRNVGGTALLYESKDLLQWTYLHPILIGDQGELGTVWECPNLFPLGNRHVLLISILPEFRHTYYLTGDYTQQQFHPTSRGKVDHGAYFYAAQTMRDEGGRRLMWGWIKEGRDAPAQLDAGWSGVMSLPRVLELLPNGTLSMTVAPELTALRDQRFHWADIILSPELSAALPVFQGCCLEIAAEFEVIDAASFGLWIHCSPGGEEQTLIAYDVIQQSLIVDRRQSSLDPATDKTLEVAPFTLAAGESLKLHIYIDHSVLEVFADSRVCLTSRIYPTRPDSSGISPIAFDGRVGLKSLDIWTIKSIWKDSKTNRERNRAA
jgi:beta-fructofuranosidase